MKLRDMERQSNARLSRRTISLTSTVLPSHGDVTVFRSSVNDLNGCTFREIRSHRPFWSTASDWNRLYFSSKIQSGRSKGKDLRDIDIG
jgi:hypothetical protein